MLWRLRGNRLAHACSLQLNIVLIVPVQIVLLSVHHQDFLDPAEHLQQNLIVLRPDPAKLLSVERHFLAE